MICVYHSKDLDGYTSGAVVKRRFPEAIMIGWDYADDVIELPEDEDIVMIDITFPLEKLIEIGLRQKLVIIDHHISFFKQVEPMENFPFEYIYEDKKAACEIGWKYFFPDEVIPEAITVLGKYDTWRQDEKWEKHTLPFQYGMRNVCHSPETFPEALFHNDLSAATLIGQILKEGRAILSYQETFDRLNCKRAAFERHVFTEHPVPTLGKEGYTRKMRAICLNQGAISSNTMKSVYDPSKHDVMIGFQYTGKTWAVSLRTDKTHIDVSAIAKAKGGGGHRAASGFEVESFEEIFK